MSKLSQKQVRAALESGGFSASAAAKMAAIGVAESKLDPNAIGDTSLETAKWGPSVGVFQIRTLKAETGTGSDRDIQALQGSLPNQVRAALNISSGGRDFTPWTTYKNGAYLEYLSGDYQGGSGLLTAPAGWVQGGAEKLLGGIAQPLVDGFRSTAYVVAFSGLGLVLIGAGVYKTFDKQINAAVGTAAKVIL